MLAEVGTSRTYGASVTPKKKRVRKRPLKSLAIPVKVETMAQSPIAEAMYHDGLTRVRSMLEGICPRM
jgi:hypothetical protein